MIRSAYLSRLVLGRVCRATAAAFHNFLFSKHLEHKPSEPVEAPVAFGPSSLDDDIPF